MKALTIQQLADRAGVTVPTLRFYEREKILLPQGRNESNYRIYTEKSIDRIDFIKAAQTLGFTLNEIKQILAINNELAVSNENEGYPNTLDFAILKLNQTKNKISQLTAQKDKLEELIEKCNLYSTEEVATFFKYLSEQQLISSQEFVSCRHAYLFDSGSWILKGCFHTEGDPVVKMTGNVYIEHKNNLWSVQRKLHLLDKTNTYLTITFNIPVIESTSITKKIYCKLLGIWRSARHYYFCGSRYF